MLASLIAFALAAHATETKLVAPKPLCSKSVFASVDPKKTKELEAKFASINSLPYKVDVVDRHGDDNVVRITYRWPKPTPKDDALVNPEFAERTGKILEEFKPKNVWREQNAMMDCS